ncbi:aminoglycoside phosphotransferase family protein [Streptomyces sp. NPDC090303]|uniref:aminoglycoside phosphotransferase family protein n=1 Tax=Streptomyces sp. NPDC090303 TaxID=3365960 RepID=UPI003824F977
MDEIPEDFIRLLSLEYGEAGERFIAELPQRIEHFLENWALSSSGKFMHGATALVLPVLMKNGDTAALKFPYLDGESNGEPIALGAWGGQASVRLFAHDEVTGTMLLERLDPDRTLLKLAETDSRVAVHSIGLLLNRLTSVRAPEGLPRLRDVTRKILSEAPGVLDGCEPNGDRRLALSCLAVLAEVAQESGDRLLHNDLHFGNVLGAEREDWLAIDPRPVSGDPGYELLTVLASHYIADEVIWRFDLLTEMLALDRERATAWTLGRLLLGILRDVEESSVAVLDEMQREIITLLLYRK